MEIRDKIVWITGGTSGMGLATAKMLIENGAKVALTARDAERGVRREKELGENCIYIQGDVTKTEDMQRTVKTIMEKWGRLDVLMSNAGGANGMTWGLPMEPDMETTTVDGTFKWKYSDSGPAPLEPFIADLYVNLIGAYDVARLAAWEMRNNVPNEDGERGTIIFVSSISATKRHSAGFNCGYASGKAGILGLTKELSCNLGSAGIRVNTILPGYFDTEMVKETGFLSKPWIDAQNFPRKIGDPKNIAQMAVQLIENPFVNNAVIEVTAGFSAVEPML